MQSIARGQYEVAQALGLSSCRSTAHIILPQALRTVIPVLAGQFISLCKDTTLVMEKACVRFDRLGVRHRMVHKDAVLHQRRQRP